MIRQIVAFTADPEVGHRFVFLDDYDIAVARALYQGADVWLNTPRRPQEACGTSRHEGGAQRRAQLLDPRRLVGRVVRRRQRLGHHLGRERTTTSPAATRSRPTASSTCSSTRSSRCSTTARRAGAPRLDGTGQGVAGLARAQGHRHAHGPRLRHRALRARRQPRRRPSPTSSFAIARELAAWKRRVLAALDRRARRRRHHRCWVGAPRRPPDRLGARVAGDDVARRRGRRTGRRTGGRGRRADRRHRVADAAGRRRQTVARALRGEPSPATPPAATASPCGSSRRTRG